MSPKMFATSEPSRKITADICLTLTSATQQHHVEQVEKIRQVEIDNREKSGEFGNRIENCFKDEVRRPVVILKAASSAMLLYALLTRPDKARKLAGFQLLHDSDGSI